MISLNNKEKEMVRGGVSLAAGAVLLWIMGYNYEAQETQDGESSISSLVNTAKTKISEIFKIIA